MKKVETLEELNKAINAIDWDEIHIDRIKYDYGYELWLYWDDENDIVDVALESSSSLPGPNNKLFGVFKCDCEINSDYSDGWATYDAETGEYITEDNRRLSKMEMAIECIQYGDFSEMYEYWKQQLIDDFLSEVLRQ